MIRNSVYIRKLRFKCSVACSHSHSLWQKKPKLQVSDCKLCALLTIALYFSYFKGALWNSAGWGFVALMAEAKGLILAYFSSHFE